MLCEDGLLAVVVDAFITKDADAKEIENESGIVPQFNTPKTKMVQLDKLSFVKGAVKNAKPPDQ